MKTVGIIGADSMLGKALKLQLQGLGLNVISIGRAKHNDIAFDLLQSSSQPVSDKFKIDVAFHCASSFAGDDRDGIRLNFLTNTLGSLSVLDLMDQLKCQHIVFSGSIWSCVGSQIPGTYTSYGLSKAEGEEILKWGIAQRHGIFSSLRFSQLFDTEGLCCRHQPWFGRIIAYASRGLELRLPASIKEQNFIHVSDAARLMISAAESKISGSWPVCHYESLNNTRIAELAYREFDCGGKLVIDMDKNPFQPVTFPEDRSIFAFLNDEVRINMADGIAMIHHSGFSEKFGPLDVL
jgi:nucleoside-diphosphate-sugar epimerase